MARRHRGNIMTGTTRVNELAAHAEITTARCAARDDGRRILASDAADAGCRPAAWRGVALFRFAMAMLLGWLFMTGAQAQGNSVQSVSVARGSNDSQVVKISIRTASCWIWPAPTAARAVSARPCNKAC